MELLTQNSFCPEYKTAVTIGKFDGFHKGHQKLIEAVLQEKKHGFASCVLSLRKADEAKLYLYTEKEKRQLCEQFSLNYLADYSLNEELFGMSPEEFLRDILKKKLNASVLVVGEDFLFGHDRKGDVAFLLSMQQKYDFRVVIIKKMSDDKGRISSSRIRALLSEGRMEEANNLLGRRFSVSGPVLHGKQLGRTLSFPTINLSPDADKLLPKHGVYCTKVTIRNKEYTGITNVGLRPTVDQDTRSNVETHLLSCNENLYGENATVSFCHFLREEQCFSSTEELKKAMEEDLRRCKGYFKNSEIV